MLPNYKFNFSLCESSIYDISDVKFHLEVYLANSTSHSGL